MWVIHRSFQKCEFVLNLGQFCARQAPGADALPTRDMLCCFHPLFALASILNPLLVEAQRPRFSSLGLCWMTLCWSRTCASIAEVLATWPPRF